MKGCLSLTDMQFMYADPVFKPIYRQGGVVGQRVAMPDIPFGCWVVSWLLCLQSASIRELGFRSQLCSQVQLPVHTWEAADVGSGHWVIAVHVGL